MIKKQKITEIFRKNKNEPVGIYGAPEVIRQAPVCIYGPPEMFEKKPAQQNETELKRFCKNCGYKVEENFVYCPICGQKLSEQENGEL